MVVVEIPTNALKKALEMQSQTNEQFKKEISETLFKIGMELESIDYENTSIEISGAGNRIDLLSLEGITRALNAYTGKTFKIPIPKVKKTSNLVTVDKSVSGIRDYIALFTIHGLDVDEFTLKRLINYQEKVAKTFGRNRKVLGMGLFNLKQVKFPLEYKAMPAEEIKFAPLGFKEEMTGLEILKKHTKGVEYAHLFTQNKLPILIDATGKILTMPGVTNSNDLGKVEPGKNQDLIIEITGTNLQLISKLATCNALDFSQMNAGIESTLIKYPSFEIEIPNFTLKEFKITTKYVNDYLGLNLKAEEITSNLQKMLMNSTRGDEVITVQVPNWRSDVLHEVDLIEDIARAISYDNFSPLAPEIATIGSKHFKTKLFQCVIETFQSMQFQQVFGMILSSTKEQITKVNQSKNQEEKLVKLTSSRALGLNCARNLLLPGLLEILSTNKQYEYPQKIFEVGETLEIDEKEETNARTDWKAACVIASSAASYSKIKAVTESLAHNFDCRQVKFEPLAEQNHHYIKGRCAKITTEYFQGTLGEIAIDVLRKYGLEMPCATLEVTIKKEKDQNTLQ